jgi:hypothetical protein
VHVVAGREQARDRAIAADDARVLIDQETRARSDLAGIELDRMERRMLDCSKVGFGPIAGSPRLRS